MRPQGALQYTMFRRNVNRFRRLLAVFSVVASLLSLSACATMDYYSQAIHGELDLLADRQSIKSLIADPHTSPPLRKKLVLAQQLRSFASAMLGLPDNHSYTTYVALHRPYVNWNVFATPQFSLKPVTWCFLFAGCVPYRGYFSKQAAFEFAASLRKKGDDVHISGVPVFSTLGWFNDPLLSNMLDWDDTTLANFIFHELAHQELYVEGDADFNESYAVLVADVSVHRWLQATRRGTELEGYEARQQHWRMIVRLVDATRARLEQVYASGASKEIMRQRKLAIFNNLRRNYTALRPQLDGDTGYDGFFSGTLNNASLLTVSIYTRWVPAFRVLLAQDHGDLPAFYRSVKQLAKLPSQQRHTALEKLMPKRVEAMISINSGYACAATAGARPAGSTCRDTRAPPLPGPAAR